ncbi:Uncharacterised protein [Mycobacteroides abscessus subsp. abscessus]|nr:Uncharacterised protein [Mycobacteroides abscessus subsp. abscessus]
MLFEWFLTWCGLHKGNKSIPFSVYCLTLFKSSSISFSFSSNTLQASAIGAGLVMSTPAFFSTSIG